MLDEHLGYVTDSTRNALYSEAIGRIVTSGCLVADLGCGTGVLGLQCLKAGAGHVYAVDDSAMVEIARESMMRAGHADSFTFIGGKSSQVELPELVDVVVCDHVGYFGFDYGIVKFLEDAKRRFLKPGGMLIPSCIQVNLAAVGSPACDKMANGWLAARVPAEFHWLKAHAVNTKHAIKLGSEDILGGAVILGELDLYADHPEFFSWKVELKIEQGALMHGLAGWFDCRLAGDDLWMTNSPLAEKPINRSQAFLPIGEAVEVKRGDVLIATVMARPMEHMLAWTVEFPETGQFFAHSTWQGMLLTPEHLLRTNPGRVPRIGRKGRMRSTVLGYCDGHRSAREIEQLVLREHPKLFPTPREISDFVAQVLQADTE